jgi:histidinol-phosphate aminotransferase
MMIQPRPEVGEMTLYSPGMSRSEALRGGARPDVIKLASNESLWGPSPRSIAAAQQALGEVSYYPLVQERTLLETLAGRNNLRPENIVVGDGADEVLRLAALAYVRPGEEVIIPHPSFSAYRHNALLAGGVPVAVPLSANGGNDLPAMRAAVTPRTRLIYVCSPNNPTGTAYARQDWDDFLADLPEEVLVVVDGAYHEFCQSPAPDYAQAVRDGRPVLWVRTFSKLYALAALRVGWGAAPPSVAEALLKVRDPFSVSGPGWAAAQAALADRTYFERVLKETMDAREFLRGRLEAAGWRTYASDTNFVTFAVQDPEAFVRKALQQGFIVHPTDGFGLAGYVRVTVAPRPILEKFVAAMIPDRPG